MGCNAGSYKRHEEGFRSACGRKDTHLCNSTSSTETCLDLDSAMDSSLHTHKWERSALNNFLEAVGMQYIKNPSLALLADHANMEV